MTRFSVLVSTTAAKEFKALQREEQERVRARLNELAEDPYNSSNRLDTKLLSGTKHKYFRLRVGEFRIIYYMEKEIIKVIRIAKRSNAYSWLD